MTNREWLEVLWQRFSRSLEYPPVSREQMLQAIGYHLWEEVERSRNRE